MNTEQRLVEAIQTGEVLRVIYNGGSQPGACRKLAPIEISNGRVKAQCFDSDAVKLFRVDKLVILESWPETSAPRWDPDAEPISTYDSIRNLTVKVGDTLAELGWHVQHGDSRLSLHRRFKNGKAMKGEDVSIQYEEFAYDLVAGADGEFHRQNERKRQRPWSVRGKGQETRSYGSLDAAAARFMQWAELNAPVRS